MANASSSARTAARSAPQRRGPDLAPVHDRQPEAAAHPLEQRLVHPERRGRDAGTGVRQPGRFEDRLDRAVLAERTVERDEDDRRVGPGGEIAASACPMSTGPRASEACRVVVGRGRAPVTPVIGGQEPPVTVEVEEDRLHVETRRRRAPRRWRSPTRPRRRAPPMARPGARRPDDAMTDVGWHRTAARDARVRHASVLRRPRPAGPVAGELDLVLEVDAVALGDDGADVVAEVAHVGGACPSGRSR